MRRKTQYAAYSTGDVVVLFSLQINKNAKVGFVGELIANQFSFSLLQWEHAETLTRKEFFMYDAPNCLNCPFRGGNGCYTNKFHSWLSYKQHIKAAKMQLPNIPKLDKFNWLSVYSMAKKASYFRFGAYGEPIFVPLFAMKEISTIVSFTGYTHAWRKYPEYNKYLMASTHSESEARESNDMQYRSYTITPKGHKAAKHTQCPAAPDVQKTVCSVCLKCAGTTSKSKSNIYINQH